MSGRRRSTDRTIAAVAILRDGLVLAGRRVAPPRVRGGWEFPGGSVEAGETPEQAAVREAREELRVEVKLTGRLGRVAIRPGMWLVVFTAELTDGEPEVNGSHDELRWLSADTLRDLAWLPPDRPLLDPLAALLGPVPPAVDDAARAPLRS